MPLGVRATDLALLAVDSPSLQLPEEMSHVAHASIMASAAIYINRPNYLRWGPTGQY